MALRLPCKKGEHFLHLARILKKKVSEICWQYFKFLKFICGPPCPYKGCLGATFNVDDIQRPCESSSSGSEKSSESDDDDTPFRERGNLIERRYHIISIDPDTFDPPYWCRAVDLTKFLNAWNPESIFQDENCRGLEESAGNVQECCVEKCCVNLVSDELGSSWKDLGRELNVSEPKIQNILEDDHGQKEQGLHVLYAWKNGIGSGAYVRLLTDALEKITRKDVADKLVQHCREKHIS
ncbi:Leucine-rich repeat serine threonine- kinase 2 [Paramuricea clavata]|uniref:Leucine-rich repeat serine threonine- kinase 2 n=1 Tax=Paramuricea clavata TaxID=317549 RepID=A0A6S7IY87_PARCT|nr:Leucine-rich repeat serine threonine- kinase 2 [Paramuricea clavata]